MLFSYKKTLTQRMETKFKRIKARVMIIYLCINKWYLASFSYEVQQSIACSPNSSHNKDTCQLIVNNWLLEATRNKDRDSMILPLVIHRHCI